MKNIQPLHLVLGGAGLLLLGSFLPWATVSVKMAGAEAISRTVSGLDGDGTITLVLGIGALVLTLLKNPPKAKLFALIALILAGLAALIGFIDIFRLTKNSDADAIMAATGGGLSVTPGIGLILVIIGGAAAAFGSWQRWKSAPAAPAVAAGPPPVPPQG